MKRIGGWWRLWIVCSGLWLILVALAGVLYWPTKMPILYPSDFEHLSKPSRMLISPLTDPTFIDAPGPSKAPPAYVPAPDEKQGPWTKFQKKDDPGYLDPVVFLAPDGTTYELGHTTTKAQVDALEADYIRVQKQKLRRERFGYFFACLGCWIVPPLLVALLGLAFRWVIKGFKKEPAAT